MFAIIKSYQKLNQLPLYYTDTVLSNVIDA